MKIYDCFMYFDEDVVLDVRLNVLNKYVDKFVIMNQFLTIKVKKENHYSTLINFKVLNTK